MLCVYIYIYIYSFPYKAGKAEPRSKSNEPYWGRGRAGPRPYWGQGPEPGAGPGPYRGRGRGPGAGGRGPGAGGEGRGPGGAAGGGQRTRREPTRPGGGRRGDRWTMIAAMVI